MAEIVLLNSWFNPFGMRVMIALAEKGVTYEYIEQVQEDLTNKISLLQEISPIHKGIPVLIHNERVVRESLTIVEYIDKVWDENNQLLSSDFYGRAEARFWADFIDLKVYHVSRKIWTSKGEELEMAKKGFIESLKKLEEFLGGKPYFGGESFGFVDVALIPFYSWFFTFEKFGNFKVEAECPELIAWAKRCMQRESVSNTLVDEKEVYEAVLEYQK